MFFNENENNDVQLIFTSNIKNHIFEISVQLIAITKLLKIMQPYTLSGTNLHV